VAESYHLSITGDEPAAWLLKLAVGPPSLLPAWPDSPHLAVVVAIIGVAEDGRSDYDQVTVACTRAALRELAAWQEDRKKLYFTVDRARLMKTCPQIDSADFEER
jgi:hypothetical protein